MVDEAHALGVVGTRGHGMHEYYGIDPNEVDIWMGTLSKTLSACGGYIAGNASLIEWLRHSAPGFVYSVGLAPALAAAAFESLAILHAEPERVARLQANAALFLNLAREAGFDTGSATAHAIIPVILGSSIAAARYSQLLLARGINVQPIIYPAVAEKAARLRFFISSEHTDADIRATIAALIAIRAEAKK
jgi:7-keto-8-aminopelargonate synthetase-like enzyme